MRENVTACLLMVSLQKIISAKRKKKFRSERVNKWKSGKTKIIIESFARSSQGGITDRIQL